MSSNTRVLVVNTNFSTHRLSQHLLQDSINIEKNGKVAQPDSDLSIVNLVAKQDVGAGNLDPRAYQIELFERAKARNIIAVLDTGSLLLTVPYEELLPNSS